MGVGVVLCIMRQNPLTGYCSHMTFPEAFDVGMCYASVHRGQC